MMGAVAQAVLFDLDGTLIDSAPDLAGAGNEMRVARGMEPLPYETFRPMVGTGARGMVRVALGVTSEHAQFDSLRTEFLQRYEARMVQSTRVFEAMEPVLVALEQAKIPWGIVTNKAARFTQPLVRHLGLEARAAAVVSGDTTAHSKPHPAPLLEAARRIGISPGACVYVGDDLRDVQAAQGAGMRPVAAAWGYLGDGESIDRWGAERVIETPAQLLNLLGLA